MKQFIKFSLIVLVLLFALSYVGVEAQDMTRQDKRALIKAIRKGEATTQHKDSIIYVDKIREVVREVPKLITEIKEVPRDTCLKDRRELRFDFKQAKEQNDTAIKLAKVEAERQTELTRLQLKQVEAENKALRDSLNGIVKIRQVEGKVAKDTVRQDRKAQIAEARSNVKVARSKFYWLWGVGFIVVLITFLLLRYLPKKLF